MGRAPAGCEGAAGNVSCSNTVPGNYTVTLRVTDSNGVSAVAAPERMVVAPPLEAALTPVTSSPIVGEAVGFTSSSSGGTGPFTWAWAFGDGVHGTGPTVNHSYASTGTYTVLLWVNDSVGVSRERSTHLRVSVSSPPAAPGTVGSPAEWLWVGAVVAVAAVVLVLALWLRRRKRDASTETPDGFPTPGSETERGPPG